MPNSEVSLAKQPCMSGIYLDHSIVEQKGKICFRQFAPTCAVNIINQYLTVGIAQQKSLAPLVYTLMTVFQIKEKNYFNHCTYMCCKIINQSMPNSEDSLAKQLCTTGIYLYHSIVEHRKKHVLSIAPTLYMYCKMINQCLTVRIP